MSVSFKAPLKSSVVNAAFMSRTVDTDTIGKVGLANALPISGVAILNIQQLINEIKDAVGVLSEGDITANDYTEENYISNGDSYKVAIDLLDQAVNSINDTLLLADNFLLEYIDDTAFETANGLPASFTNKTGVYYNSTDDVVKFYNKNTASWEEVGTGSGGGIGVQENIGTGNGTNVSFSVTNTPTSEESIIVYLDGLVVEKSDWSFANPVITFNSAPPSFAEVYVWYLTDGTPSTPSIGIGTDRAIYHTVTSGEETAKSFTIPVAAADSTKVICDIVGGVTQEFGVDYTIAGTSFNWSGLGLDGLLLENDIVRLYYII